MAKRAGDAHAFPAGLPTQAKRTRPETGPGRHAPPRWSAPPSPCVSASPVRRPAQPRTGRLARLIQPGWTWR